MLPLVCKKAKARFTHVQRTTLPKPLPYYSYSPSCNSDLFSLRQHVLRNLSVGHICKCVTTSNFEILQGTCHMLYACEHTQNLRHSNSCLHTKSCQGFCVKGSRGFYWGVSLNLSVKWIYFTSKNGNIYDIDLPVIHEWCSELGYKSLLDIFWMWPRFELHCDEWSDLSASLNRNYSLIQLLLTVNVNFSSL